MTRPFILLKFEFSNIIIFCQKKRAGRIKQPAHGFWPPESGYSIPRICRAMRGRFSSFGIGGSSSGFATFSGGGSAASSSTKRSGSRYGGRIWALPAFGGLNSSGFALIAGFHFGPRQAAFKAGPEAKQFLAPKKSAKQKINQ